jgi:hypothetical protein
MEARDEQLISSRQAEVQKKRPKRYTKGELNKLVDSLVHPLCKKNSGLIFVDGLLHALIEQNPPQSVSKFIRYNLPKILEQLDN